MCPVADVICHHPCGNEDSLERHLAPLLLAIRLLNNGFQVVGIAQESHTGRKERLELVCQEGISHRPDICQTTMQDTEVEMVMARW